MNAPQVDIPCTPQNTATICRRTGEFRWQVLPEWESTLFGPKGLLLGEWLAEGNARIVTQRSHRTVYSVELAGQAFFVKHNRPHHLWDVARHLVRASSARREWHHATELIRRGIPTIEPVAWQEDLRGGIVGDSYFVGRTLPGVCPLDEFALDRLDAVPGDGTSWIRRRTIEGLARFLAAVHRAGVADDDLQSGNLLVRVADHAITKETPLPAVELFLIDASNVRFSGPLGWRASRKNLIVLSSGWWQRTSARERSRFWRIYLAARPELDLPRRRSAARQLEAAARAYSQQRAQRRDQRTLRTNRDFVAVRQQGNRAHAVRDLAPAELKRLLDDPDALLQRNLHRPVKLDRGSLIVHAELPLAEGCAHVFYKRYRPRNWRKALLGKCRRGKALQGWCHGHALLLRQVATPRPLVVCDVRRPWYRCQSYLVTEWIEGSENLHLYAWKLADRPPAERLRRANQCARNLGVLIGRMHAGHLTHGDLKGSNLLVVQRPDDVETYLVDTDDVRIADSLTWADRAADLARLAVSIQAHPWVSRTVCRRFLRAYSGPFATAERAAWKSLWHQVARLSSRITGRKRRRGDPIL